MDDFMLHIDGGKTVKDFDAAFADAYVQAVADVGADHVTVLFSGDVLITAG